MKKQAVIALFMSITLLVPSLTDTAQAKEEKDRKYYEARGEIVWEVPTDRQVIALTFDDGPDPNYTPQIAALLKQYNARATFFVVGSRVKQCPQIARMLAQDHHELANHTYSHPSISKLSKQRLRDEIIKTQETINQVTGVTPHLFRPPGGYYSEKIVEVAKQAGFLVVMWSWHQDTRDWSDPGMKKIRDKVLNNARNGDIVLFHDYGGNRDQTVEALKQILPELKRRGYHFVTVSELMKLHDRTKKVGKGE